LVGFFWEDSLQEAMIDHKQDLLPFQREILKEQYSLMFDELLKTEAIPKSETEKQINSFLKARDKIFTFLLHPNVPPDNNGSERAIRNIKVKLKVSQQFKSAQGAKDYATLRSIVDTARKRISCRNVKLTIFFVFVRKRNVIN